MSDTQKDTFVETMSGIELALTTELEKHIPKILEMSDDFANKHVFATKEISAYFNLASLLSKVFFAQCETIAPIEAKQDEVFVAAKLALTLGSNMIHEILTSKSSQETR